MCHGVPARRAGKMPSCTSASNGTVSAYHAGDTLWKRSYRTVLAVGMSVSRALLMWTDALYVRLASVSGPSMEDRQPSMRQSLDSKVIRALSEPFGQHRGVSAQACSWQKQCRSGGPNQIGKVRAKCCKSRLPGGDTVAILVFLLTRSRSLYSAPLPAAC